MPGAGPGCSTSGRHKIDIFKIIKYVEYSPSWRKKLLMWSPEIELLTRNPWQSQIDNRTLLVCKTHYPEGNMIRL